MEAERRFMKANAKRRIGQKVALAPQIFNDDFYCGDYEDFQEANENRCLEKFLRIEKQNSKPGEKAFYIHQEVIFNVC